MCSHLNCKELVRVILHTAKAYCPDHKLLHANQNEAVNRRKQLARVAQKRRAGIMIPHQHPWMLENWNRLAPAQKEYIQRQVTRLKVKLHLTEPETVKLVLLLCTIWNEIEQDSPPIVNHRPPVESFEFNIH